MNDMSKVITPKSDQQNADDLIAGPITIRVSGVDIRPGTEQPVSVRFEGDEGKPWKPCKSMCRIMVAAWGADAKAYVGRSMTLYRDPTVKWGGMDVGGVRISHMSDIDRTLVMALTATKGSRKPYTVKPLDVQPPQPPTTPPVINHDTLLDDSRNAAMDGTEAYRTWFGGLTAAERIWLADEGHHETNKKAAQAADGVEG
jgi:hypothetical protein